MVKCLCVDRRLAEKTLKFLREKGLLDGEHRIMGWGGEVCIPVKQGFEPSGPGFPVEGVVRDCNPPPRRVPVRIRLPGHDRVGDVIIIRENALPEKYDPVELAEVFRSVYGRVSAIYVKESTVGAYRIPSLRLVWGRPVEMVTHKEYGLRFRVRFGKVYFNPRLSEEHRRIAELAGDGERVFDVFTGIGGFAIHIAALRDALVFANDLNPEAYSLLLENILLNRRRLRGRIMPLNLDAVEIPRFFTGGVFDRVIANLPHSSLNYMDVYKHLLRTGGILHLYFIGRGCGDLSSTGGWRVSRCRSVLDYGPGLFIYRVDLVKV